MADVREALAALGIVGGSLAACWVAGAVLGGVIVVLVGLTR